MTVLQETFHIMGRGLNKFVPIHQRLNQNRFEKKKNHIFGSAYVVAFSERLL